MEDADRPHDVTPADATASLSSREVAEALADARVVHALLRAMSPSDAAATAARVDRAMDRLEAAERDRFALRMRRAIMPWVARGAAAAAMLGMALILTRMATTPSPAYAELAAIASAAQTLPPRRYVVVSEHGPNADQVVRRHGTLDLGPDGRFLARVAPMPGEERAALDPALARILQDERVRMLLADPTIRDRLASDPATRDRMMRLMRDVLNEGRGARSQRGDHSVGGEHGPGRSGRDWGGADGGVPQAAPNVGDQGARGERRRAPDQAWRGRTPDGAPPRMRPPRGHFDPIVTFGHDGHEFWTVSPAGVVLTSDMPALLQGRIELADGPEQLVLDQIIERLQAGHRLERSERDEIDPQTGRVERIVRIVATRLMGRAERTGPPTGAPSVVTVEARASDRVVTAFEAVWTSHRSDGPFRRMAIELIDEPLPMAYDLAWFGHAAHDDGRPVIRVDESMLTLLRELRSRPRPIEPSGP